MQSRYILHISHCNSLLCYIWVSSYRKNVVSRTSTEINYMLCYEGRHEYILYQYLLFCVTMKAKGCFVFTSMRSGDERLVLSAVPWTYRRAFSNATIPPSVQV